MRTALLLEDFTETRIWLKDVLADAFVNIHITEAATLEQARQRLAKTRVDLALIDLNLPDGSGVDIIREIVARTPSTICIVATIFDDDEHIFPALQAGAQGYLLKEQSRAGFTRCLRGLLHGEPPLSPAIARKILQHFQSPLVEQDSRQPASPEAPPSHNLSSREQEILTLVAKGYKRNEIGPMLGISPHTVSSHLKTIYSKLNVSTRAEATMEALRMGLLSL